MQKLCIDQQIVSFKGKSALKQYNPQKPKKLGYKLYIFSGVGELIYNLKVHTGTITICPNQPDLKASGNIVLILLQNIPRMKRHKLYFKNRYTSIELVTTLYQQRIACAGTVRSNRLPNNKLTSDTVMKRKDRGSMEIWTVSVDNVELRVVHDNRAVTLLSSYEVINPTTELLRWDRKERKKVKVTCPSIVNTYNKFVGGVDC